MVAKIPSHAVFRHDPKTNLIAVRKEYLVSFRKALAR